jgi:hypothetical protein
MNATIQPDTDTTSSAEGADFDAAGFDLISQLDAIRLARVCDAGGKKLFCRLPSPLKLALLERLTAGGRSPAAGHSNTI